MPQPRDAARWWGLAAVFAVVVVVLVIVMGRSEGLHGSKAAAQSAGSETVARDGSLAEEFHKDEGEESQDLDYNKRVLARCNSSAFSLAERTPGTLAYKIKQADCGLGYPYKDSPSRNKSWTVALLGNFVGPGQPLDLTGFLIGRGRCPYSKKCNVIATKDPQVARRADVVVVYQSDFEAIMPLGIPNRKNGTLHRKPYRVLYWTEAVFTYVPLAVQKGYFDFEMGMHHFAPVLNPFGPIYGPTSMLTGDLPYLRGLTFIPPEQRTGFALSVISHCEGTFSYRQEYIDALSVALGPGRVHQYGRCGNMELPPKPIGAAAKIINTYKFYLAFENTIMGGYTTEKLYMPLMMNIIPIYYGAMDAPNITKTPSYIRVSQFSSPKRLAEYLLFLDAHHDEYMRYHAWRKDPLQFDDYYLDLMAKRVPGPEEMKPYRKISKRYPRSASACRLCDANLVEAAVSSHQHVVHPRMSAAAINSRFFADKLKPPKP